MVRWFARQKLQKKMIYWYTLFAILPILLITFYMNLCVRQIMSENLQQNLDNQVNRTAWELDEKASSYFAVSNQLYMDETLWSYLMADYSRQGYEDLYRYVDGLFSDIKALYPEIDTISVLSTNRTLPRDQYYFYYLEEEELAFWDQEFQQAGNALQMCLDGEDGVCFVRLMNRFETGTYRNFLKISLDRSEISNLLKSGDETITTVLIDQEGEILLSDRAELEGLSYSELDLSGYITRECETSFCGTVFLYVDSEEFLRPLTRITFRMILVAVISAGLAFLAIFSYSRYFQRNVDKVLHGAGEISRSNYSYKITDVGTDEIGMIAESVNHLGDQIQENIRELYEKELSRRSSELNQLQEQINPHFLYNALSAISAMALNNLDPKTSEAIRYLADFYRISLNKGNQELTIREELLLLESYMKIQKVRFEDGVVLEYDLDESLLEHKIMKLTLQPIVENAIHHGRKNKETLHILIRLYRKEDKTVINVVDDGCGIPPEKIMDLQNSMDQSQGGYGLRNVNIRLQLQYGTAYGVSLESEECFGTKVIIELP